MNLFGIYFILVSCLSSLCVQLAHANWPVFSIEKGGTAVVPCVPKGDETAYFWSKGEDFATSQSVASRVLGIPSPDSEKYLVNEDGSLVIYNVTLADGGIYHCRIVSENTNCRGAVSIEVTVNDFKFGIEQCEPRESCTLQVEASKETKLTCMAKDGPSSLSLKWFNGSKEINSDSNEHPLNEESSTISETITVPNEFGLPLTCEAVDSKDGQTCGRFAHVRLNRTDTAKQKPVAVKSSARWIVPLVLVLFTVVIVSLMIYIYERRKTYKGKKQRLSRMVDEKEALLGDKDKEINTAKRELAERDKALKDCEKELKSSQEKLKQATDSSQECWKILVSTHEKLKQATDSSQAVKKELESTQAKLKQATVYSQECEKELESLKAKLKQSTEYSQECGEELVSSHEKLKLSTDSSQECGKELVSTHKKLKQATDSSQECGKELESTQAKLKQATDSSQDDTEG